MKLAIFQFNMFAVNTYLVWDEATDETAIIDPGMTRAADNEEISKFIGDHNLKPKYLINTHLHLDHTFGDDFISQHYGLPVMANEKDAQLGRSRGAQARAFGLHGADIPPLSIDHELRDGEKLYLGKEYLEVLEVPGHSPGSVALYCPAGNFVITGDALFNGSIGRTDLAGGNHAQLIDSIRRKLFTLPPETVVYPGHGNRTTIGGEKITNPYF